MLNTKEISMVSTVSSMIQPGLNSRRKYNLSFSYRILKKVMLQCGSSSWKLVKKNKQNQYRGIIITIVVEVMFTNLPIV